MAYISPLSIVSIILIILLILAGIEFFIRLKKYENRQIEDVRKPLQTRLTIIMILTFTLAIVHIINLLTK